MSVLILMYHRTPKGEVGSVLDVTLAELRDQVRMLRGEGYEFISFADAVEPRFYSEKAYASITFDDGHVSNLDAFDLLHDLGVRPTNFVITDWAQRGVDGYMTTAQVVAAAAQCEIGGHGASHTDLTAMSKDKLFDELTRSKAFLEDVLQRPITAMSAPGGKINREVVRQGLACGFRAIGNSLELINTKPRNPLNRICVKGGDGPRLLTYARANRAYWLRRQARLGLNGAVSRSLGQGGHAALKRLLGR